MGAAVDQQRQANNARETDALRASHIVKTFSGNKGKSITALAGVDIRVPYGKKVALIGPDGAGKTTFIRIACGLYSPSEGTMSVLGLDVDKDASQIQADVGYMPQRFGLYEDLSVAENMDLYADLHAIPKDIREERIHRLLTLTGLAPFTKRLAGRLSGGMKQKLGLACTLLRMPPLLLLDEPTVGVDPLSRREVWEIIDTVVKEDGMTVLVSTGYMEEAEQADVVYIIDKGRILASGTPQEVTARAASRCFSVIPPAGISARVLQAVFLSNENVVDAVPDGGRSG
jgi:ABC-2 type transport system ATP-binding protein